MAVRSARLAAGKINANTATALFTVPVGGTWVIKDLRCQNNTGSTGDFDFHVTSGGATVTVLENIALANGSGMFATGFIVLGAGDTLFAKCNVNAVGFNYWVSGAKLQ